MLVKNILETKPRDVITIAPDTSLQDAMGVLIDKQIGCLPVMDAKGAVVGIVTDRDMFKKVHETKGDYQNVTVSDIMVEDVIVGQANDELVYIAGLMKNNWIRHVPVVDGSQLIGIVSQRDIVTEQAQNVMVENRYLKMYTEGMSRRDKSGDI